MQDNERPTWIRGPQLRKRWDDMSNSSFYRHLHAGLIPQPEYPFANGVPYWRLSLIEAFEQRSAAASAEQQKAA